MQRVDGNYLYQVGSQIHPLAELTSGVTTYESAYMAILVAEGALEPLLTRSVFRLRTSFQSGRSLLVAIQTLKRQIENGQVDRGSTLGPWDLFLIQSGLASFEAVLGAELALLPLYVVQRKAGYDTATLIEDGLSCFPPSISSKAPEAMVDIMEGTKALAFELFTAAGFHLHRANEAVLRKYWDAVADGAKPPKSGNMGDFLKLMEEKNLGDEKVRAALKDLKNLHRNPLIHPEHRIGDAHEAIALMNNIHVVMVHMLKEIPGIEPATQGPSDSIIPPFSPAAGG